MLRHWSQLVPNMSADIWGHYATLPTYLPTSRAENSGIYIRSSHSTYLTSTGLRGLRGTPSIDALLGSDRTSELMVSYRCNTRTVRPASRPPSSLSDLHASSNVIVIKRHCHQTSSSSNVIKRHRHQTSSSSNVIKCHRHQTSSSSNVIVIKRHRHQMSSSPTSSNARMSWCNVGSTRSGWKRGLLQNGNSNYDDHYRCRYHYYRHCCQQQQDKKYYHQYWKTKGNIITNIEKQSYNETNEHVKKHSYTDRHNHTTTIIHAHSKRKNTNKQQPKTI